jgi:aryl-alcohol dehydrogenase (NADP+)
MQYVNLGKTGLKVSRLCLGMMTYGSKTWREWILTEEEAKPFFKRALDAGINFFDTADVYSLGQSEVITGNLVKHFGVKRKNLVIATKVNGQMSDDVNDKGLSRKHIMDAIDKSLKRLQMDHVDLYQIHRWDYNTPIEETLEALNDIVRAGKARYIGASSMFAWQFQKALHISEKNGWSKFVSMQNHYNLVYREEEREMIPLCRENGIGLIPWSPMARGFFARNSKNGEQTSRYRTDGFFKELYGRADDFLVVERTAEVGKARGLSASQVALAWVLSKPFVTSPIIGTSKMNQFEEALAVEQVKLTDDEITRLEELYQPHPVLGHS